MHRITTPIITTVIISPSRNIRAVYGGTPALGRKKGPDQDQTTGTK
jgi:hypothetical protein